ncbi:MAG: glycosyltransferase, partial [Flavobacteriales bacterium]
DESQKNITGILHTLATLRNSKPEFKFYAKFVGGNDSEKLGKLRTYAASLGLTETFLTFSGPLSSEEVAKCMQSSDALVLFSRNENFPCVIAEAWASGVPVISTDVGGISEHLVEGSGRGMLIESGDESGLREAILSLGDGAKFNSDEIRKYATKHFSVEAISEAFDKVYREALRSGAE